jgi:hypothetical protein
MKKLFISLFLIFFTVNAFAYTEPQIVDVSLPSATNEYYCDLDAVSNGDGSIGSPWNSWQNAENGMGTASFPAYLYVRDNETLSADFTWGVAGSGSGSELVITNWTGHTSVTTMSVSGTDGWRLTANYVIIDGGSQSAPALKWYNSDNADAYTVRVAGNVNQTSCIRRIEVEGGLLGMEVQGGVRLYNNTVHSTGSHCIYLSGSTTSGARTPLCIGNIARNAGRNGIQHNPHDTDRYIVDGITSHNVCYDNTENGITILSGTGATGGIFGLTVYNNLCWDNGDDAVKFSGGADYAGTIEDVLMYNNTFYGGILNQHGDTASGEPPTTTFRNNIVTGTITHATDCSFEAESNNLTSYATSNFESITDTDSDFLKLKITSTTAIGQSYDVNPPVADDYWGNTRDLSGFDIGAYEYTESAPASTHGSVGSGGAGSIGTGGAGSVTVGQ